MEYTTTPDWNLIYRAMAEPVRRTALNSLVGAKTGVSALDLAAEICDDSDEEAVERVAVSLYHVHLPMLAEAGLVRYDDQETRVWPTTEAGRLPMFVMRPQLTMAAPANQGQRADD